MIHPLLWPPNSSYPLLLNQFIYYFTSVENRNTFMLNPLKYLRQPKPSPAPPIKIAVVGPPKSGKTTGETQDNFLKHLLGHVFTVLLFHNSCTDVCSKVWLGTVIHWQRHA